jgi:mono/diheme cytochrome c family protein
LGIIRASAGWSPPPAAVSLVHHEGRRVKPLPAVAVGLVLAACLVLRADPPAAPGSDKPAAYQKDILPFLKAHCLDCHGAGKGKPKADLSFNKYTDDASLIADRKTWDTVQHMLKAREMPPKERPQPKATEIDAVSAAITGVFDRADATARPNAGRVTLRRLNRTEYDNTIRDLIGVRFHPADDFPADDVGYGFDNIGDVLSVSPLLLEKYLTAAEAILDEAVVVADPPKLTKQTFDKIRTGSTATASELGKVVSLEAGEYRVRLTVGGEHVGTDPVKVMLRVMGENVKAFDVKATADKPEVIEAKLTVKPGTGRVGVLFLNPDADKKRVLHLKAVEVEGPFDPPPVAYPDVHKRLMAHKPGVAPREAAREIVTRFATAAFRRPVKAEEVDKCLALYDAAEKKGQRFELRVRAALYRVLVSPHFLFRVELDPPDLAPGTTYPVSEYELASRLSYFLWNSMPDQELFTLASQGKLRQNLDAQVKRMVKDPKSQSFLHGFAEQWLTLRKLDLVSPDSKLFPTYTPSLRDAMLRESLLFFEAVVRDDRPIPDLLDADFTFVNGELAKHYGVDGVKGAEFVRVKAPAHRGGLLTHAGVLTLASNATRASPVKRGKFVLEQLLNTPPPPPPPELEIPELEAQKQLKGTLRQQMEQHRANAVCASCHQRMDPIGFAFEQFDAVGAWREKDGGAAIDASGTLPDGRTFDGPAGLKKLMRADKAAFVKCVSEKMLTYALGRGLEDYDRRTVKAIVDATGKADDRFSALLIEIVKSDPFQKRTTPEK